MHKGPPGCLLAAQCPSPSAGSWPPHCSRWLPHSGLLLCSRSCQSQPADSDASGGIRRSSLLAATSDSWLVKESKKKKEKSSSEPQRAAQPRCPQPPAAPASKIQLQHGRVNLSKLYSAPKQRQDLQRSQPLLNLPASASYLQSPIWISPCRGGLAETPGGGETKNNSQCLLLPLSHGEWRVPVPPCSMSCVSPMTWPGRSRVGG